MTVRDLVLYPDDRLRKVCPPVEDVQAPEVQALIDDMIDTMYDAPGVGLAAPQVGELRRLFVVDVRDPEPDEERPDDAEASEAAPEPAPEPETSAQEEERRANKPPGQLYVFINPEIVHREGKITWEEGCLSIPGLFDDVERAARIRVRALDRHGNPFELEAEQLLAVCIQHELDHLNGVLFLDHLSRLKLRQALKKYKRTLPDYLHAQEKKKQKASEEA